MGAYRPGKIAICLDRDSVEWDISANCVLLAGEALRTLEGAASGSYIQVVGVVDTKLPKPRNAALVIRDVEFVRILAKVREVNE